MKSNILNRYEKWKIFSGHENIYAKDVDLPIDNLIPGISDSIENSINLIKSICQLSDANQRFNSDCCFFEESTYSSGLEANLQFLTMWSFQKACSLFGVKITLNEKFPIITRIIKTIELSPYVVKQNKDCFIVIPSSFFRFIDEFLYSFLKISELGESIDPKDRCKILNTNFIGGGYIELAIKLRFRQTKGLIQNIMGLVGGKEVFWTMVGFNVDYEKNGFPVYLPEYLKSVMLKASKKMGDYVDETKLVNNQLREYYLYPTVLFTLFHEIAHYTLGHLDKSDNITKGYRSLDEELEADQIALYLYTDFINTFYPKNNNDSDISIFISGPCIYFNAFIVNELFKQIFYKEDERTREAIRPNYFELISRLNAIENFCMSIFSKNKFSDHERNVSIGSIKEFNTLKHFVLMAGSQIFNDKKISYDEIWLNDQNHSKNKDQYIFK